MQAIRTIISKYGHENVILVYLPNRKNSYLSLQNQGSDPIANQFISQIKDSITIVDLRSCPLGIEEFHTLDGHPNESGQILLGQCALENQTLDEFLEKIISDANNINSDYGNEYAQ